MAILLRSTTAPAAASQSASRTKAIAIGLGVAIPMVLLIIFFCAFWIWRRRRLVQRPRPTEPVQSFKVLRVRKFVLKDAESASESSDSSDSGSFELITPRASVEIAREPTDNDLQGQARTSSRLSSLYSPSVLSVLSQRETEEIFTKLPEVVCGPQVVQGDKLSSPVESLKSIKQSDASSTVPLSGTTRWDPLSSTLVSGGTTKWDHLSSALTTGTTKWGDTPTPVLSSGTTKKGKGKQLLNWKQALGLEKRSLLEDITKPPVGQPSSLHVRPAHVEGSQTKPAAFVNPWDLEFKPNPVLFPHLDTSSVKTSPVDMTSGVSPQSSFIDTCFAGTTIGKRKYPVEMDAVENAFDPGQRSLPPTVGDVPHRWEQTIGTNRMFFRDRALAPVENCNRTASPRSGKDAGGVASLGTDKKSSGTNSSSSNAPKRPSQVESPRFEMDAVESAFNPWFHSPMPMVGDVPHRWEKTLGTNRMFFSAEHDLIPQRKRSRAESSSTEDLQSRLDGPFDQDPPGLCPPNPSLVPSSSSIESFENFRKKRRHAHDEVRSSPSAELSGLGSSSKSDLPSWETIQRSGNSRGKEPVYNSDFISPASLSQYVDYTKNSPKLPNGPLQIHHVIVPRKPLSPPSSPTRLNGPFSGYPEVGSKSPGTWPSGPVNTEFASISKSQDSARDYDRFLKESEDSDDISMLEVSSTRGEPSVNGDVSPVSDLAPSPISARSFGSSLALATTRSSGESSTSLTSQINHSSSSIATVSSATTVSMEELKYPCPDCDCKFRTAGQKRNHYNRKHNLRYKCILCTSAFGLRKDLERHEHTVHKDEFRTEIRLFCPNVGCSTPDKEFNRKDNFQRHVTRCQKMIEEKGLN